jgi:hypothetical protein
MDLASAGTEEEETMDRNYPVQVPDVPWVFRSRVAGVWSCYGFGGELEFVFDRGEHAERGVAAAPVVEDLQVLE